MKSQTITINSSLTLNFIVGKEIYFQHIRIFGKTQEIKNAQLLIDIEEQFKYSKAKKIIDLELIHGSPIDKGIKFKMNIFYGINYAYCFLSEEEKILVEYNFIEYENILYENKELNQYDGNGLVKRIVLINAPTKIYINENLVLFLSVVYNSIKKGYNSFEICECNYAKNDFAFRVIKEEQKFISFKKVKEQEKDLNLFQSELKNLINKKWKIKSEYSQILSKYKINNYEINFCQPKSILKEEFKDKNDYYIMYLYYIWYSLKTTIINESFSISIVDLVDEITSIYKIYLEDDNLFIYEKVLLFCSNVNFFIRKNNIEKYKSANLKYVIKRKDIKEKSVYWLSFKFLKTFISNLNNKSYLFFPFLMLDCGTYSRKEELIYGYNRESCDIIQSHLEELLPEVFFEYDEEGTPYFKENGFNYKGFNVVFLNRKILFKNFHRNTIDSIYEDEVEEKIFKHYSVRVSKTIIHESFAHIKFIYDTGIGNASPVKFFNRNKVKVKLITYYSKENNNDKVEYLKVLENDLGGESGKFLEYFFGTFEGGLIIDLIYEINHLEKLYDNVGYFLKDNLTELQKYIINKYKIYDYNLKYRESDISFEEENKLMEEIIECYEKIRISSLQLANTNEKEGNVKQNENIIVSKKNIVFYERKKDPEVTNKGYEYYRKKLFDEDNFEERDQYYAPFFDTLHIS